MLPKRAAALEQDVGSTIAACGASTSVPAPHPDTPINHQHLGRFTCGDQQLEREVLQLFVDQLPKLIAQLKNAETPNQWKQAAHTLKGSARAVGAAALGDIAERVETAGEARAASLLEPLAAEASAVVAYVKAL